MKTKLFLLALLISFAGLFAQQKIKMQKVDESGFIEVDEAPVLISKLNPSYPEIARLAGIEGIVYLKILVDENGNVEKTKIEQGAKDMLDNAALAAAKKAKFSPALVKDKPVKVWVILPIAFKLDVDKKAEGKLPKSDEQENKAKSDEPDINGLKEVEKLPELIEAAKPEYPEIARRAGITGNVFVKVLVDKEGIPKKAIVIKTDSELFNQSAINAAMKSKYTPAINKGEKTEVWIVLPYRFAFDKKDVVKKYYDAGIPNVTWIISTKEKGYPAEAFDNKLEGKVIIKALFNKNDKSITQLDLIEGINEILNKGAIEYVKKDLINLIEGYESVRQKYYKQRPKEVLEPREIKDTLIVTILYQIEE